MALLENVENTMLSGSFFSRKGTHEERLKTVKIDGKLAVDEADDIFLVVAAQISGTEFIHLLNEMNIDRNRAAIRFRVLSFLTDTEITGKQLYDALVKYKYDPEIVSVAAQLETDVAKYYLAKASDTPETWDNLTVDMITSDPKSLLYACQYNLSKTALFLIETGKSEIGCVSDDNSTPLIYACDNKMAPVAIALIKTGESNPGHVDDYLNTALLYCCDESMVNVALELIDTKAANPGQINHEGQTALLVYSQVGNPVVADAIVKTNQSNPGYVGPNGKTALIQACERSDMQQVALDIIATKQSNPSHADNSGNTALINACKNSMSDVAIALLSVGSHPYQMNSDGHSAFHFIRLNKLTKVFQKINSMAKNRNDSSCLVQ